jgi:hypothetical protein
MDGLLFHAKRGITQSLTKNSSANQSMSQEFAINTGRCLNDVHGSDSPSILSVKAPIEHDMHSSRLSDKITSNPTKVIVDRLEGYNRDAQSSWRTSVHALNVLRLIFIDATLGKNHHTDRYISDAIMIAISGFKSLKWAVRNSSMMLFTALVQRTVDSDKNVTFNSPGKTVERMKSKAIHIDDFFTRFPSLFPFLLSELAFATNHRVVCKDDIPESVIPNDLLTGCHPDVRQLTESTEACDREETPPSLFPLLLMLSKMNGPILSNSTTTIAHPNSDNDAGSTTRNSKDDPLPTAYTNGHNINIELFLPLILICGKSKIQKIREISALALTSVVSSSKVCCMIQRLMDRVLSRNDDINGMHGALLGIWRLLEGLRSFIYSYLNQTNEDVMAIYLDLQTRILPQLQSLQLLCCMVFDSPPLGYVLHRVLLSLRDIFKCHYISWNSETNDDNTSHLTTDSISILGMSSNIPLCVDDVQVCAHDSPYKKHIKAVMFIEKILLKQCVIMMDRIRWSFKPSQSLGVMDEYLPYEPLLYRDTLKTFIPLVLGHSYRKTLIESLRQTTVFHYFLYSTVFSLLSNPMSEIRGGLITGLIDIIDAAIVRRNYNHILMSKSFCRWIFQYVEREADLSLQRHCLKLLSKLVLIIFSTYFDGIADNRVMRDLLSIVDTNSVFT